MLKSNNVGMSAGFGVLILAGALQASPIILNPISTNTGNTSWQDIKSASYDLADLNGNNLIDIGETVTFSVVMHKQWWGTHDYDAMKVWIDGPSSNLLTQNFIWDYEPSDAHYAPGQWTPYSNKAWTDGDRAFTFDYTFAMVGDFYLSASVMCSADLSGLNASGQFDRPTNPDWNAWTKNIHAGSGSNLQGEDERYKLTVSTPAIPEPASLGLMGLGVVFLATFARKRRKV